MKTSPCPAEKRVSHRAAEVTLKLCKSDLGIPHVLSQDFLLCLEQNSSVSRASRGPIWSWPLPTPPHPPLRIPRSRRRLLRPPLTAPGPLPASHWLFYQHKSLSGSSQGSPLWSFRSQLKCPLPRGASWPSLLSHSPSHRYLISVFACYFPTRSRSCAYLPLSSLCLPLVVTVSSRRRMAPSVLSSTGSPAQGTVPCTEQAFKTCAKWYTSPSLSRQRHC